MAFEKLHLGASISPNGFALVGLEVTGHMGVRTLNFDFSLNTEGNLNWLCLLPLYQTKRTKSLAS